MNYDLVKLKVKLDGVIDVDIQTEIIRLKDRMNNLETWLNARFSGIEMSINDLMKNNIAKVTIQYVCFFIVSIYIYI